ncbi:MAG: hypothetical protein ACI9MC_004255 [Kiritimatiellia bacterium]|jgi:hypothetical protein
MVVALSSVVVFTWGRPGEIVRWSMAVLVLLASTACRKQVVPVAVVVPPLVPEVLDEQPDYAPIELPPTIAEPKDCSARGLVAGEWSLVTEVSHEVPGGIGGINGYYQLNVDDNVSGDACSVKATLRKVGYGRGSLQHEQVMFGETFVRNVDESWPLAVNMAAGGEVLRMVLWVHATADGRLEGYWHYMNASWVDNPLYGVVEARRSEWAGGVNVDGRSSSQLAACSLSGRSATGPRTCRPGMLAR